MEKIISIISNYEPYYLLGARNTVALALCGVVGGVFCGMIICILRINKMKGFLGKLTRGFAKTYIEVFRNIPVIVQLWIAYFWIPKLVPMPKGFILEMNLECVIPCLIAISLNSGAYVSEIFRSGIEAVDRGQMEAALCVGMNRDMANRLIVVPQAIKNVLPALCNEFVTLVKETAVISYMGVADLTYKSNQVKTITYEMLPCYLVLALHYFVLCFVTSRLVGILERRMHR